MAEAEQKLSNMSLQICEELVKTASQRITPDSMDNKIISIIVTHILPSLKNLATDEAKHGLRIGCEKLMGILREESIGLSAFGAKQYNDLIQHFLDELKDTFMPEIMRQLFPLYANKMVDNVRALDLSSDTMADFIEIITGWNQACTEDVWKIKI